MATEHDPHYFRDTLSMLPAVLEFYGPNGWCCAVRAGDVWKLVESSEGHNIVMANAMVEQDTFCAMVAEVAAVYALFGRPAAEGADNPITNPLWGSW